MNRDFKRENRGFCSGCYGCISPCGRREILSPKVHISDTDDASSMSSYINSSFGEKIQDVIISQQPSFQSFDWLGYILYWLKDFCRWDKKHGQTRKLGNVYF